MLFIIFMSFYFITCLLSFISSYLNIIFVNLGTLFSHFHYLDIICEYFFIVIFFVFFTTEQSYFFIMYPFVLYIIIHLLFSVSSDFLSLVSIFFRCCSYIFNSCLLFNLIGFIFLMSFIVMVFFDKWTWNPKSSCSPTFLPWSNISPDTSFYNKSYI